MKKYPPLNITGIGVLSGAGLGVEETRGALLGKRGISHTLNPEMPVVKLPLLPAWYQKFSLDKKTPAVNILTLVAVEEALLMAGLTAHDLRTLRVGVCLGSTVGGSNFQEEFLREYHAGSKPSPEAIFAAFETNTAQFISRYFSLCGPLQMVCNACSSGADALGIGAQWLQADLCDIVIAGGCEVILPQIYYGFKSLQLSSLEMCKPFDKDRKGLTLGDGVGIVVLEKQNSPRKALATLQGYGSGNDAYHPTAPHPEARGLNIAVKKALRDKKISEIDFISAHGTATLLNDLVEGKWIKANASDINIVATKAYTGHTLAAAGAISAVFSVISLQEQVLPKSAGFTHRDPELEIQPTTQNVAGKFNTALSLTLGFGGANAALLIGVAP